MSSDFLSLYNKYRPRTLKDLVGQEHISTTLIKAFEKQRLTQAYLMCGSRGSGKTTTARCLAMGFNCEKGVTASPCGECQNCLDILNERCIDIVEIDAASKNGVDDIREMQQSAATVPSQVRTKFYIIDECHQMSSSAQNALLKTLEEPPKHVVLILCTTEPEKLKDTILSRCQVCEFRRITVPKIAKHLKWICEQEKFTAEEEALTAIARSTAGGMRDAVVKLSTAMCDADDGHITEAIIASVVGNAGMEECSRLVDAIIEGDAYKIFQVVGSVADAAASLQPFYMGVLTYFRNMMALATNPKIGEILDISSTRAQTILEQATKFGLTRLIQCNKMILFYAKMVDSIKGRMVLETMCLEMLGLEGTTSLSAPVLSPLGQTAPVSDKKTPISTDMVIAKVSARMKKLLSNQCVSYSSDAGFEIKSTQFNKVEKALIEKGQPEIVTALTELGGNAIVKIIELDSSTLASEDVFGG